MTTTLAIQREASGHWGIAALLFSLFLFCGSCLELFLMTALFLSVALIAVRLLIVVYVVSAVLATIFRALLHISP